MSDCLFCRIALKEIPSTVVYENEKVIAFRDINPKAPCHVLVAPRLHVCDVHEIPDNDRNIMADIFDGVKAVIRIEGIEESGYRLIINSGKDGGQLVPHLHVHILGKKQLSADLD